MKKNISLLLVLALTTNNLLPAAAYLDQARSYAQQGYQRALQGKERVKRLWYCFRNPTKCTPEEAAQANLLVYGTTIRTLLAILLAVGIVITRNQLVKLKIRRLKDDSRRLGIERDRLNGLKQLSPEQQERLSTVNQLWQDVELQLQDIVTSKQ